MIAAPLAPPVPVGDPDRPAHIVRMAGGVLLAVAAVALAFWSVALSPFGFRRWDPFEFGSTVSVRQAGTYVVFLEYEGAAAGEPRVDVDVSVRTSRGRRIPVTPVTSSPFTYDTPWHEGRAVATFTVDAAGSYDIMVLPADRAGIDELLALGGVHAAIGRDTSASWAATPLGLVVFVLLPAFVGLVLLAAARERPTDDDAAPGDPAGGMPGSPLGPRRV